jgi:Calcineurin-like phosphoesterase
MLSAGFSRYEQRAFRLVLAALGLIATTLAPARSEEAWSAPPRVVAIGDVHGDYDQFVTVLKDAGLVDGKLKWTGGTTHLVQTGDRLDRGAQSRKVMDLLMRLEKDARKAGGMVHPLLGNHEAMNMLGDLRYVTPEEFAAFKGTDSQRYRDAIWEQRREERKRRGESELTSEDRKRFDAETPLGYVEHRLAFAPKGAYGAWLIRQNAVIRIGDTLFLHGGISAKYADFSLADLNDKIRRELQDPDPLTALVAQDPEGPLWYRGLAQGDPALLPHLEAVLTRHGCRRMVVGHTPTEGFLIFPRYGGRLVMIDVGLSKYYGGPPAALILEGGQAFALHRGKRLPLPDGEGEPLLRYVREVSALEPDPSRLKPLLGRLEGAAIAAPSPP